MTVKWSELRQQIHLMILFLVYEYVTKKYM